ncbi:MAG: endonuclease NucS domain-containing protein [Candidatus Methylomirabilia bacterium]
MVKALPGVLEFVDGTLMLRDHAQAKKGKERQATSSKGRAGGESAEHKALKEYIFRQPDQALRMLRGLPFLPLETEHQFPTGDEVDVTLQDVHGRTMVVEVKPRIGKDDIAAWGQAAKYRTLWAFFEDEDEGEVRAVVAAPRFPARVVRQMYDKHKIESVVVPIPTRVGRRRTARGRR